MSPKPIVFLCSPVWEHFSGSIVSQGLQMRVYGICNVSWNCSSWSQCLEVILWCFQNCMIRHKIVRSYLGKAMFIYFISDTLKNNSLQSTIQLHSDNISLITDYKNPTQQYCQLQHIIRLTSTATIPQFHKTFCKCGSCGWENLLKLTYLLTLSVTKIMSTRVRWMHMRHW